MRHYSLIATQQSILADRFRGRYLQIYISESILTMHMLCESHLTVDELIRAFEDLHITSSNMIENIQCISGCILESAISRGCGEPDEVEFIR